MSGICGADVDVACGADDDGISGANVDGISGTGVDGIFVADVDAICSDDGVVNGVCEADGVIATIPTLALGIFVKLLTLRFCNIIVFVTLSSNFVPLTSEKLLSKSLMVAPFK